MNKPNIKEMSRTELRKYIVETHDEEAIQELFVNRRNPNAKVYPYNQTEKEIEEILRRKISGEL